MKKSTPLPSFLSLLSISAASFYTIDWSYKNFSGTYSAHLKYYTKDDQEELVKLIHKHFRYKNSNKAVFHFQYQYKLWSLVTSL